MKYTLDTDFSALNGPKAANWMLKFSEIADAAFAGSSSQSRLLANLLILEPYVHTLRQGLERMNRTLPVMIQNALNLLWGYLDGNQQASDLENFANNFYASTLNRNVGEEITDAQAEFYRTNFEDVEETTCEWNILTWLSVLMMELLMITGGRLDFEEYREYQAEIGFREMDEMLSMMGDACIELTGTPCASLKVKDVMKANELVYQTTLFREFIGRIQNGLKTALSATPNQYAALRREYQQYTILPAEYAEDILKL